LDKKTNEIKFWGTDWKEINKERIKKRAIKRIRLNLKKKWNKMLRKKIERKKNQENDKKTTIKKMNTIFDMKTKQS
jgi:hypothetical protein